MGRYATSVYRELISWNGVPTAVLKNFLVSDAKRRCDLPIPLIDVPCVQAERSKRPNSDLFRSMRPKVTSGPTISS